jgi:hypothetical protein
VYHHKSYNIDLTTQSRWLAPCSTSRAIAYVLSGVFFFFSSFFFLFFSNRVLRLAKVARWDVYPHWSPLLWHNSYLELGLAMAYNNACKSYNRGLSILTQKNLFFNLFYWFLHVSWQRPICVPRGSYILA